MAIQHLKYVTIFVPYSINPYKTFQKSSYSSPEGYSKDYEDANRLEGFFSVLI